MRLEQPSAAIEVARFETPLGQVRRTTLVDGSHVVLGGRSALSVRYSRNRRIVVAERGEAFFRVAHNPDRPFVVEAGPVTVTAIGTAFSVQRDGDTIGVVVSEGVVEVQARPHPGSNGHTGMPATLRVAAGQRVRFDRGEITQTIEPAAFDLVTPWREGRLEFRDEPLRLIVARINRYSPRQLEISDPSIADLRLTTTVYRGRVDAWLDGLVTVLPVRVTEKDNDHAVISPAN
jgi:transmembrane sensor